MQHIARLLDIPGQSGPPSPAYASSGVYINRGLVGRGSRDNKPLFTTGRGPGFAAPRRDSTPSRITAESDPSTSRNNRRDCENPVRIITEQKRNGNPKSRDSSKSRSRDGSPRMPRPRSEEIPLELIKKTPNGSSEASPKITILSRPQTPRSEQEDVAEATSSIAIATVKSEETSFIAQQDSKTPRKKGAIETV